MFEITHLLRSANNPVTVAEFSRTLEVVPHTVYRDIATLQSMRVPIGGETGIGYVMRPDTICISMCLRGAPTHRGKLTWRRSARSSNT